LTVGFDASTKVSADGINLTVVKFVDVDVGVAAVVDVEVIPGVALGAVPVWPLLCKASR